MHRTIKDATVKRYFYKNPTISCARICGTSSAPTTSPEGSRPSKASPLTNSSVRHGTVSTAPAIQTQPAPANAGTKHLAWHPLASLAQCQRFHECAALRALRSSPLLRWDL